MSVLVVWASRLGSTKEIAERIAGRLAEDGLETRAESADAATIRPDDEAVVIGSAVYAGHWLAPGMTFARKQLTSLAQRPVWLFSVGPVGERAARSTPVEPKDVEELERMLHPRDHRTFAGALDRADIDAAGFGRVERFIGKHFVPEGDFRDWDVIDHWADGIVTWLRATHQLDEAPEVKEPVAAH
jgi:menaquinone-dependent protoporphyrinogen oxidase